MAPVTDETTELPTNHALRDRIVTMAGLEGMLTRERLPKRAVARAYAVLNPDEETTPDEEKSSAVAILVSFNDLAHLRRGLAAMVGEASDQLQGVELRETTREHAFVQRGPFDFDLFTDVNSEFDASRFHHGTVHAVRTMEYRYEQSDSMERLIDLPDEDTDVREAHPEVTAALSATLDDWVQANADPVESESESQLDDAMRRQLRDLGYVE